MLCEAHGYWAVAHLIQINRGTSPIVSIVCWAVVHLFQINRGLSPIVFFKLIVVCPLLFWSPIVLWVKIRCIFLS